MKAANKNPFAFEGIPKEKWPFAVRPPKRVLVSDEFMVQVYAEKDDITRLSVLRKKRDKKTKTWVDGITWDELQRVKNAVGYANFCAVEVFPEQHNVVNVAAIRHLWVLPERPDFVWCAK